jgi:peptidoglycan hydrolase-like protein with peptidoglycan-binding domain
MTLRCQLNSPVLSIQLDASIAPRHRLVIGLTLAGFATGTLATWFSLTTLATGLTQAEVVPTRHWPAITYDPNHSVDVVRVIQWMLEVRNYDIGPTGVDGFFGSHTLAAVMAFQMSQHLQDTGEVDDATWEPLIMPSQMGSRGGQVMALQQRLQSLGFLSKQAVNGNFDLQTEQAVSRFQRRMHLPEQGEADLNTWCMLVGGILQA